MATGATVRGFGNTAGFTGVRRDANAARSRLVVLERILEGLIRLPGNQRVGLDALIGFVPVVGDLVSASIGTYLVWEARNIGMPRWRCAHMLARVGMDTAIGAVPFAGDLFDFFYRANTKNLRGILAHIDRQHPSARAVDGVRF